VALRSKFSMPCTRTLRAVLCSAAAILFVDRAKGWQLLFRDEKQAVLASRTSRAAAPYSVRGQEVVVKGPQISLVLTRSGKGDATQLEGLGFVFVRKKN
jgi:hypothetical protein